MRQFSIYSLLLAVSYIAVIATVCRLVLQHMERYEVGLLVLYPGVLGLLALVVLPTSAVFAILSPQSLSGWHWLNLSWLIVSANVNYGFYSIFYFNGTPNREHFQEGFSAMVISSVPLPFLLTLPILYILVYNSIIQGAKPNYWTFAPSAIALIDTLVMWFLVSAVFGTLVQTDPLF